VLCFCSMLRPIVVGISKLFRTSATFVPFSILNETTMSYFSQTFVWQFTHCSTKIIDQTDYSRKQSYGAGAWNLGSSSTDTSGESELNRYYNGFQWMDQIVLEPKTSRSAMSDRNCHYLNQDRTWNDLLKLHS